MILGDYVMQEAEPYNDYVVRLFLMDAAVWGVVGMAIGVHAAAQLACQALNFDVSWLTFSRKRSNHTFDVIVAFGGSALMGTWYYVVQRTGHTRLALPKLTYAPRGWQLGDPADAEPGLGSQRAADFQRTREGVH